MQKKKEEKDLLKNIKESQNQKKVPEQKVKNEKVEEGDEDDEEDEEFFEMGKYNIEAADMKLYKSQLEETDEIILFRDLIFLIKSKNP